MNGCDEQEKEQQHRKLGNSENVENVLIVIDDVVQQIEVWQDPFRGTSDIRETGNHVEEESRDNNSGSHEIGEADNALQ